MQQRLLILGDTQRSSVFERLIGREQNDAARSRIVTELAAEDAKTVLHLGDMMFRGGSRGAWQQFDRLMKPVRDAGMRVYAIFGNHDYWGGAAALLRHAKKRFAEFATETWYTKRFGDLGIVFLDSNKKRLSGPRWKEQLAWYESELQQLDADPSLRAVVVLTHHPPFTNSKVTGDERHVEECFARPFQAAEKTLLMLSGHVHAYEHFVKGNKHFVVSGGGGGPRVKLHEGAGLRHKDLFIAPAPRPFHYLVLQSEEQGIALHAKGFVDVHAEHREFDRFLMPYSS